MKRAIISSTADSTYGFFTPIAARLWRDVAGYEPLVFLFKDENEWSRSPETDFVLKTLKEDGRAIVFIGPVDGYRASTVIQLSRVLAAAVPFVADDDYLLTSDVDMLPLNREYFHRQDPSFRFHIFSADAYTDIARGQAAPKYPMCYLGASARDWRDVMGFSSRDVTLEAARALEGRADTWSNDEDYFMSRLSRSPLYAGGYRKVGDHYAAGSCELFMRGWDASGVALRRFDRVAPVFHKDAIDAHFFRPGYTEMYFLSRLVKDFCPSASDWVARYVETFNTLVGHGKKDH